jgi:hypothetical protein
MPTSLLTHKLPLNGSQRGKGVLSLNPLRVTLKAIGTPFWRTYKIKKFMRTSKILKRVKKAQKIRLVYDDYV